MYSLIDFVNEYLIIEYGLNHNSVHCLINKVEGDKIYLSLMREFEKTGLLVDDIVKCRIDREQSEYNFKARISGIATGVEVLNLIITPITEIEQYINVRGEKRVSLRFIAFTDEKNLASVINVSKSGILLSSKIQYGRGDMVQVKLLISYPSTVCNFIGEVVRVCDTQEGKKEYGIRVNQFKSNEDAAKYSKFVNELIKTLDII